jgi:hypothetical protein
MCADPSIVGNSSSKDIEGLYDDTSREPGREKIVDKF